ncbi:Leucine-rich repeat receptor serine/threonine-protein kinase [Spatholobus suberectus]|nr:Leucine-rich repeat receptor serine/threonine-protein kinase [Spatholobus suberectus]
MVRQADLVIIGVSVGVTLGILISCLIFFGIRWYKKRAHLRRSANESSVTTLPIRTNGLGTSTDFSASLDSSIATSRSENLKKNSHFSWWNHQKKDRFSSASGILKYSYKEIQKATQNFTTTLGQGSFGTVYKATMPTGEVVAVKVLAPNSKQGEKEFQTEVFLLGRLHHRNLVNLVGYCVDKGQRILVYQYMSNGSLANLLYGEEKELSWDERLQIALDISQGIEYLHEGAIPPVIHRDLKSANILLDHSMRAKVADFGLSKEEIFDGRNSGLKGGPTESSLCIRSQETGKAIGINMHHVESKFTKRFCLFCVVTVLCISLCVGGFHAKKCAETDKQALLKLKDGCIHGRHILSSWKGCERMILASNFTFYRAKVHNQSSTIEMIQSLFKYVSDIEDEDMIKCEHIL